MAYIEQLCGDTLGCCCSGKTTVGRLVASALRYPFLDCDTLIEAAAGASVAQIFADEGEEAFRDLETQVLQVRAASPARVLAGLQAVRRKAHATALMSLGHRQHMLFHDAR